MEILHILCVYFAFCGWSEWNRWNYLFFSLFLWNLSAQIVKQLNSITVILPSERIISHILYKIRFLFVLFYDCVWFLLCFFFFFLQWIGDFYFFSVGYFVTSVVDKLIGRCIARRRAKSGTNSTPPVIMHVRDFTYLHFLTHPFVCSHNRDEFSWLFFRWDNEPSAFSCEIICFVTEYLFLQSQKQLMQHCDGSLIWFDTVSLSSFVYTFAWSPDELNEFVGLLCETGSNACSKFLSVHPIDFMNDWPNLRGFRHGAPAGTDL